MSKVCSMLRPRAALRLFVRNGLLTDRRLTATHLKLPPKSAHRVSHFAKSPDHQAQALQGINAPRISHEHLVGAGHRRDPDNISSQYTARGAKAFLTKRHRSDDHLVWISRARCKLRASSNLAARKQPGQASLYARLLSLAARSRSAKLAIDGHLRYLGCTSSAKVATLSKLTRGQFV